MDFIADSLRVQEDEDNCAVIQSARDALKLVQNKYLPAVCSWVQLFTRAGMHGRHLEATINLKAELESVLRRCRELGIEPEGTHRPEVSVAAPVRAQPSQQAPLGSGMFLFLPLSPGCPCR
ncbi:PREDICTED: UV-stimulated scaffold protein A-like [Hipposideros armiger]|uniref:UV-stimulated scaffold protein A-like n=1 Tax=Hipposideros armiger TaxID=186990 RepID=A0A8B7QPW4_HIPAR|nr:PREDICTED: UV-stimulated scaffold protein A-like [Hipposideros armiger]